MAYKNKEDKAKYQTMYRKLNPDKVKEYSEKHKEYMKKYYIKNKEKLAIKMKQWNKINHSQVILKHKEYYKKNKDSMLNKMKEKRKIASLNRIPYVVTNETRLKQSLSLKGRIPKNLKQLQELCFR